MEETNVSVPKASSPPDSSDSSDNGNKTSDKLGKKAGKSGIKAGASIGAKAGATEAASAAIGAGATKGIAAAGSLVDKAIGAITAPLKALGGMASKAFGFVTGGISKIAGALGGVFGGAASSVAVTGVVIVSAGAITVGGIGMSSQSAQETSGTVFNQVITKDDDDCRTLSASTGDSEGGDALTNEQVMKNAYVIYSAFTQYGMTDAQAYGILANMNRESSLYPSMCQGHSSTPMFGESVSNPVDYTEHGGGVGLVQWTPVEAKTALYNAAVAGSYNWYDLEFQVTFMLSPADVNFDTTQKYIRDTASFSATDSARWFLKWWERCGGATTAADHTDPGQSGTYYNERWHDATADTESMELTIKQTIINYANDADLNGMVSNILANATAMGEAGASNSTASGACTYGTYDNSSAANAAVAFSWPEKAKSFNNGTALYQKVYNAILSDRVYYKSCDRNVICAIAWSGTDDNFATKGGVDAQYDYLSSGGDGKWTKVGVIGSGITMADCQPGDILIITAAQRGTQHGHVVLFTGEDAIKAVHGDAAPAGANVIAASYLDYSPCAQVWTDSGANNYTVYRCTKPDKSDTYIGAGGNEPVPGAGADEIGNGEE